MDDESKRLMDASRDALGDKMKALEQVEAGRRANHDKPLMARLDGKAFHTFTQGLKRPYDTRLSQLMVDTTKYLVEKTHAKLGYTQSDEISLCWWNEDPKAESVYMFDGKFQKLTSVLAGMASGYFCRELPQRIPEKSEALPIFDCRVWNVTTLHDVYLNFLWRQDDAIKNSISMAAQAHYSPRKLHGVGSEEKKKMLRSIGKPWEDEPRFFTTGTYVQRVTKLIPLTQEQLEKIPEQHRPDGPVLRSMVEEIDVGYIKGDVNALDIFK